MKLPSGVELTVTLAPFAESKALLDAILEEARGLRLDPKAEVDANLWKDCFCVFVSSQRVQAALEPCMRRAAYGGVAIHAETFEPEAARDDYLPVCYEVAKVNITPFTKSLYARFSHLLEALKKALA
jgi:hypothetical protein